MVFVAALVAAAVAGASAQEARLRIAVPTEATYLVGSVRLLAIVEPPSAARDVTQVTFFADGTQVCAVTTAPFECEWDAGDRIRAHQIRAVALMRNGRRLVQMVTTKDLAYVENVDVDVVQITAIVTDDHGRFVTGLTQKDFQVSQDGRPQTITSFSNEQT